VLGASQRAGINLERVHRTLVHGLRHTYATELVNTNLGVYTLILLGHESIVTSQLYVVVAGNETRSAAAPNSFERMLRKH
jgi:site-specific recombinase XerD